MFSEQIETDEKQEDKENMFKRRRCGVCEVGQATVTRDTGMGLSCYVPTSCVLTLERRFAAVYLGMLRWYEPGGNP